jgi:hypothetical protein
LEVRVVEALPWLVAEYSDLDWAWLMREAKLGDVQNRLGFLVTLGRQLAEKRAIAWAPARFATLRRPWNGLVWCVRTLCARIPCQRPSAGGFDKHVRLRPATGICSPIWTCNRCPMPHDRPPDPWRSFFREIDKAFDQSIAPHCIGGFAMAILHGLPRPTIDVDCLAVDCVLASKKYRIVVLYACDTARAKPEDPAGVRRSVPAIRPVRVHSGTRAH